MEPTLLYAVGGLVAGIVIGAAARHVSMKSLVNNLNEGVNVFRGDDVNYTPRQNAHWLLGEVQEHKDEVLLEEKKAPAEVVDPDLED